MNTLDIIAPENDENGDNWRAIRFLMNAQYQEEFDKTTISSHTATIVSSAPDTPIPEACYTQQENKEIQRKRAWKTMTTNSAESEDEQDDDGEYNKTGVCVVLHTCLYDLSCPCFARSLPTQQLLRPLLCICDFARFCF